MIPGWALAGLWGLLSGSALLIGAGLGYTARVAQRVIAAVMAFGSGVMISAVAFDLMNEAYGQGGFVSAAVGFLSGAAAYSLANSRLSHHGAKHRKRSGGQQPSEEEHSGSGTAIAVGALLDGVPESIAIGTSLLHGGAVSLVMVAAVFLSNVPEGLSSSAGMKRARRSARFIFGIWGGIALISGAAALTGFLVFSHLPASYNAATTAVAAGAILAMLADTMIPEAFSETHELAGLLTALGFLVAFALSKRSGG